MPSNTTNLEGYTVFSSVSLAGSGATLQAQDQTVTRSASVGTLTFTNLAGSAFTVGSSATTRTFADGTFQFSVLSLTTNGAALRFRSGQTIYTFASVSN